MHAHASAIAALWTLAAAHHGAAQDWSPSPDRLRDYHLLLASEPHMAGTEGDARTIAALADAFRSMGIASVDTHDIWPLLATPVSAHLEIVSPVAKALDLRERAVATDAATAGLDEASPFFTPFNAYSASADVTAPVVYANYATREDFEELRRRGVDCSGKIVIARYGGNYRGYKARFAEQAGAAGLIIFSDPADVGYAKGLPYPEGTYANDCCTQRGSILVTGYQGDPLTPGVCATREAARIPIDRAPLPRIPVQPIGYGAAGEILSRMTGAEVPDAWQGGLPMRYRIEGGPDLRVRLAVEQRREIKKTSNVVATIPGAIWPDEKIIVGCHHDAWVFGASDPTCGTIVLLEAARLIADRAAKGDRPARSIVFAAWGAEEWGIIGSSEWVEAHRDDLLANAVLYLNLDMAAMGPNFAASSSPSLRTLIESAARSTPQAGRPDRSVFDAAPMSPEGGWSGASGDLGGGSDHVAFLCHAGVPVCAFSSGGARGYSYHSVYDTLPWYWRAVGTDYAPASMLSEMTARTAWSAAGATVLPIRPDAALASFRARLRTLSVSAAHAGLGAVPESGLLPGLDALDARAAELAARAATTLRRAADLAPDATPQRAARVNALVRALDRAWLDDDGLPDRPWFKNTFASPDENSGYAPWVLPLFCRAIERADASEWSSAVERSSRVLDRFEAALKELDALIAAP